MNKRISLVAGYDRDGIIHDHVIYFIRSLAQISDVYFHCDNELAAGEADKLTGLATICGARRHGRYDFGSWAEMIEKIGWETIGQFDELILTNDSCYGPLHDLGDICDRMSVRDCDFWGMTSNREIAFHIQSYFAVFRKSVTSDPQFQSFWKKIGTESSYEDIVKKYEVGLSRLLLDRKFVASSYIASQLAENLTIFPLTMIRDFGMPFVKVKCFKDPYIGSRERISLLFRHLRTQNGPMAAMITQHQKPGFLARAMLLQQQDQPFYCNYGFVRVRAIRNNRLKISLFDRWRIIIRIAPKQMRWLSRRPHLHVNI